MRGRRIKAEMEQKPNERRRVKRGGNKAERELISRIKESDDRQAMDSLMERFLPLLHRFAGKYRSDYLSYEDAFQVAAMGFMEALERYDPDRGTAFISFLYPTVDGILKRHYRDCVEIVRIPRRLRDLRIRALREKEIFFAEKGREARISEIACILGEDEEVVIEALAAYGVINALSLEGPCDAERSDEPLISLVGRGDPAFEEKEQEIVLEQALAGLPDLMRMVLELRMAGWTQRRIAMRLQVSQMQVSRLEHKAMDMIGECFLEEEKPAV